MTQTLPECLELKAQKGLTNLERGTIDRLKREYKAARQRASDAFEAGDMVRAREQGRISKRKKDRLQQIHTKSQIRKRFRDADSRGISSTKTAETHWTFDKDGRITQPSIESEKERVLGQAHSHLAQFFSEARPNIIGNVPKATSMKNVVREMQGADSGDLKARELAKAMNETQKFLVREANRAGIDMPLLENRGPAQIWSKEKLDGLVAEKGEAAAKREFVDMMRDNLDRENLIDVEDGLPMEDFRVNEVLDRTFDKITKPEQFRDADGNIPTRSISVDRSQERILKMKDAEAWLRVQERFGNADSENRIYDTLIREMEDMSADIAMARVLGPRPDEGKRQVQSELRKRGAREPFFTKIDALHDVTTGKLNIPEYEGVANFGHAFRAVTNAAVLGGAFLTALTDIPLSTYARNFATGEGLGRAAARQITRSAKTFGPGESDARQAIRLGLTANGHSNRTADMNRMAIDEMPVSNKAGRLADQINQSVMRLSLLERWTSTNRWAFQIEMLGNLTSNSNRPFEQLPTPLQRTMEKQGIDAGDWDAIRGQDIAGTGTSPDTVRFKDPETGESFIHPMRVSRVAPGAGEKLHRMLVNEARFAVPVPGVKERAGLTAGQQSGTFFGELARTGTMLKSFPITIMGQQAARVAEEGVRKGRVTRNDSAVKQFSKSAVTTSYLASLTASATLMGALVSQINVVTSGKEPRDMDNVKFWADAAARAGTLGLVSDVAFGSVSRFGLGSFLLGPAFDTAQKGLRFGESLVKTPIEAFREGEINEDVIEETDIGREGLEFLNAINPAGSLWWTQLALQRTFGDHIQQILDPEAEDSFDREREFVEDKQQSEFFFGPGALTE